MTSLRKIEANRRNALKSTGPITSEGKERSRCNAVRHGLTAETVIAVLESSADYQAFEAAVISDYDAETAVERELVLRLASVLWRLRRATAIETAIFDSATEDARSLFEARLVGAFNFDEKASIAEGFLRLAAQPTLPSIVFLAMRLCSGGRPARLYLPSIHRGAASARRSRSRFARLEGDGPSPDRPG